VDIVILKGCLFVLWVFDFHVFVCLPPLNKLSRNKRLAAPVKRMEADWREEQTNLSELQKPTKIQAICTETLHGIRLHLMVLLPRFMACEYNPTKFNYCTPPVC
jgi:hypothetical protein